MDIHKQMLSHPKGRTVINIEIVKYVMGIISIS